MLEFVIVPCNTLPGWSTVASLTTFELARCAMHGLQRDHGASVLGIILAIVAVPMKLASGVAWRVSHMCA